jgi:hypothetical protein
MVERGGLKPSNKDYVFNTSGRNNSGEGAADKKKQKSKGFSLDLARRINEEFMGALPDSTKLSKLYKRGGGAISRGKWREILQGLETRERTETSAAVIPLFRKDLDIGSIRKAEIEELCEIPAIGPKKAAFIKEMFKAKDRVAETEETRPTTQVRHEPQQDKLYDLPFIHNPIRKSSR